MNVALTIVLSICGAHLAPAPGGCAQQQLVTAASGGPLSLQRREGSLYVVFAHHDSSVGLTYPMHVHQSGRRLSVTIEHPRERVSAPAFGTNFGQIGLPPGLAGSYRLDIRFGDKRARYDLEVGEPIVVKPRGTPAPELAFAASEWRTVPPGFVRVSCIQRSVCAVKACSEVMATPPIATMPALPSGAYLDATPAYGWCVGKLDEAALAVLRGRSQELEAAGCGSIVIDRPSAPAP